MIGCLQLKKRFDTIIYRKNKKIMLKKKENIIIVVLAVAVIALAYMQFGTSTPSSLSAEDASKTALSFINEYMLEPGTEAELVGTAVSDKGLYKFFINLEGEEISSYITKDGTMLFPQGGIDLTEVNASEGTPYDSLEVQAITYDENSNIIGEFTAPITIVEFSDFQCSFCAKFHNIMKEVMDAYPTQVKVVYKHFPLDSIHPYARVAAEASECAAEQGKFWEYADGLYANQSKINLIFLGELATDISLDADQFNECVDGGKYVDKVEADYQEGITAGVTGTPGSFINGESLGGAASFESVKSAIEGIIGE